jgi:hypothetical protein
VEGDRERPLRPAALWRRVAATVERLLLRVAVVVTAVPRSHGAAVVALAAAQPAAV